MIPREFIQSAINMMCVSVWMCVRLVVLTN